MIMSIKKAILYFSTICIVGYIVFAVISYATKWDWIFYIGTFLSAFVAFIYCMAVGEKTIEIKKEGDEIMAKKKEDVKIPFVEEDISFSGVKTNTPIISTMPNDLVLQIKQLKQKKIQLISAINQIDEEIKQKTEELLK